MKKLIILLVFLLFACNEPKCEDIKKEYTECLQQAGEMPNTVSINHVKYCSNNYRKNRRKYKCQL